MKHILFFLLVLSNGAFAQSVNLKELSANAIQGAMNRSGYTTTANAPALSGFDSFLDETNRPTGQIAGWPWYRITIRNGSGPPSVWRQEIATHFKTAAMFERTYDEQITGYLPWKRIHSNRWFPVSETVLPTTGDVLTYNGTEWAASNQSLTIAQLRLNTAFVPPKTIFIADAGKQGTFVRNDADFVSPDNTGTKLVTAGNVRYDRVLSTGEVSLLFFDIVTGSVNTAQETINTASLQKALNTGLPIVWPVVTVEYNGTVSLTNTPLNIRGAGRLSVAVQNVDADLISYNTDAGYQTDITIRDLALFAAVDMTTGAGIRINSKATSFNNTATISNVSISRITLAHEWKYGIWVTNPNDLLIENVRTAGNNRNKMIGIRLDNDQAAISSTIKNCKVYDAWCGIYVRSSTFPGIEGLRIEGNDCVGVRTGIDIASTYNNVQYMPPHFVVSYNHINAWEFGILIVNVVQALVNDNVVYLYNDNSTSAYGITGNVTSESEFSRNKIFAVGTGPSYGMVFNGPTVNISVVGNFASLRSYNVNAVILQAQMNGGTAQENVQVGGNGEVLAAVVDLSGTIRRYRNTLNGVLQNL